MNTLENNSDDSDCPEISDDDEYTLGVFDCLQEMIKESVIEVQPGFFFNPELRLVENFQGNLTVDEYIILFALELSINFGSLEWFDTILNDHPDFAREYTYELSVLRKINFLKDSLNELSWMNITATIKKEWNSKRASGNKP